MGSHSTLTADSRAVLEGTENFVLQFFRFPPQADPEDVDVEEEEEEEPPCAPPQLAFEDCMTVRNVVEDRLKDREDDCCIKRDSVVTTKEAKMPKRAVDLILQCML
jgi:hypothetical protein